MTLEINSQKTSGLGRIRIHSSRNVSVAALLLALATSSAQAKKSKSAPLTPLTPGQVALIDKSAAQEKLMVKELQKRIPLVQTYIQEVKADAKLSSVPSSDTYILSRVDFGKTFQASDYQEKAVKKGLFKGSLGALAGIGKALHLDTGGYSSTGMMDMMFIDSTYYDREHYDFQYVRNDFLGAVRAEVFDVFPKKRGKGMKEMVSGRFIGRVWIEDQDGSVVRFNGTFNEDPNRDVLSSEFLHFDSWRANLQPALWLPSAVYVEETHRAKNDGDTGTRAQIYFWGYSLKLPSHNAENATIAIDNVTDKSDQAQDLSPLQASRAWVTQAENNVLDRLVQAGLLAQPSDFDKILEQVANNIIIGNKLSLPDDVRCRVLLTTPLESLAVGNTILLSKGLVDVLPYEEDLAAVISFQLAHIVLGHHIDTRYAFSDRLLFPDESTFQRIAMGHTPADDDLAAKKAVELLDNSVYHDRIPNAGLFFAQLQARSKELKALTTPLLGDSLVRPDGTPWLADLSKNSPKLDMDKLDQIAALPLGSHLKIDPWDDQVLQLNVKQVQLLNARDKMPLEVTPIFFRLTRYAEPAPATANPETGATPPAAAGQADPATNAPPPTNPQRP